jgi:hypothetical protein
MKTLFLKNRIFSMMLLAFFTLTLVSCDKETDAVENTFKQDITGTWDISSYKFAGSEYMGVLVEKASITFSPYTGANGQFLQEVTFFEEEKATIQGTYSVNEERHEVTMDYDDDIITAKITITNGNQMLFEGGDQIVFLATKR